ncbi:HAD-IC family P-type ATPase [Streptomyces griseoincarnatus]
MIAAIDGRAADQIGIADAPRETSATAVAELHALGVELVMLTGDNQATAERIAEQLGIDTVIAEVLPGDKAAKVADLQATGRKVAMVGDGVNDTPALAQADLGIAIGAGTDVAIETADLVLMRSDPLDVPTALRVGRGTLSKMRQKLGWAIGYNTLALPIAAGVNPLRPRPPARDSGPVHVRLQRHRGRQRTGSQRAAPAGSGLPRSHPTGTGRCQRRRAHPPSRLTHTAAFGCPALPIPAPSIPEGASSRRPGHGGRR